MKTLKNTPEEELSFIGQVVKRVLEVESTTWDMTVLGAKTLSIASCGNPGMALYMLDKINPQPESIVTDNDVVQYFPFGFEGDWDSTWKAFKVQDRHRVFKR